MEDDDAAKPLEELMEPGSTLMVGTGATELEFRPMTVARVAGDTIEMLLDSNEQWVQSLNNGDQAHVTMSDNRANTWVSLRGKASISSDPALIDELWNPAAAAYFDEAVTASESRSCGSPVSGECTGRPRQDAWAA